MNIINFVDSTTLLFINTISPEPGLFSKFVSHLSGNDLLKGGILSAAIWWMWFKNETHLTQRKIRISLVSTLLTSIIAVAVARVLALYLPYRARPISIDPNNWPIPELIYQYDAMSSFPSDHATLSMCLAAGIYMCASKRLGIFIVSYSLVCILIPRIYLGLHYATDIIAGAIVGIVPLLLINMLKPAQQLCEWIYSLSEKYPQTFYASLFIFTYQTSDLYIHLRHIARFIITALS